MYKKSALVTTAPMSAPAPNSRMRAKSTARREVFL